MILQAVDTSLFGIVLWIVVVLAIVVGAVFLVSNRGLYDQIGRGGLSLHEDERSGGGAGGAGGTSSADRDEEIRQMLRARSERIVRRGEQPLDIEAELARLKAAEVDPGLASEVRQLVIARNERRVRRGEAPLDVDAEVARQLRELG
jgi:hypothetical protein